MKLLGIIWQKLRIVMGWLLIVFAALGLLGVVSAVVMQAIGRYDPTIFSGPVFVLAGTRVDCTTWWGVLINVLLSSFILSWGVGMIRRCACEVK